MLSLTEQIKTAIAKHDISSMYKLKDICDRIHSTGLDYQSYTSSDLPSDITYEEMVRAINSTANELRIVTQRGLETNSAYIRKDGQGVSSNDVKHRHEKFISDMWMGSITKLVEIKQITDALILPKFDGCSCGVRLKRTATGQFEVIEALTRGTEEGYRTKKSNITDKFIQISSDLIQKLSSIDYEFMNDRNLSEVTSLTLRGEIVLKTKETTLSAPASYVAGKINGYMDVWEASIENLEFVPYEFMRVYFDNDKQDFYIPTQYETIYIFEQAKLFNFPYELVDLNKDALKLIEEYFNKLENEITEPIDGIVYCSQDWKYPLKNDETKPKAYGKYAWKPNSEVTSTLRGVDYTLARDGKFTFILSYDPVKIKGKNYKQAKTVTSRILMLKGIGIGSVITVKLAGDISPMVVDFVPDSEIEPYTLPTKCPFCGKETKFKSGKTPTLSCTNVNCREIIKQKMVNFLKLIDIKGIAEGKLNSIENITFKNVNEIYLNKNMNIFAYLHKVDTRTFLIALGIGGKTQINKLIPSNVNPLLSVLDNFNEITSILNPYYKNDPFIKDIVDYIKQLITANKKRSNIK